MEKIYNQRLELKGQGKLVRPFHEESQLNDSGLSRVLALEAEIDRPELWLLLERLDKYAPLLV